VSKRKNTPEWRQLRNIQSKIFSYLVYAIDSEQSRLASDDQNKFKKLDYLDSEARRQVFRSQYIFMDVLKSSRCQPGLLFMKKMTYCGAKVFLFKVQRSQYMKQLVIVFDYFPG
jgi:hypothetical protein